MLNPQASVQVKQSAVIMLKNMTKYMWQQTEAHDRALSADEKQQIGKTLYALLGESADLLAEQVIAAIAWLIWWETSTHNAAWLQSSGLTTLLALLLQTSALDAAARDQQLPQLNRALECVVEALLLFMPHLEGGETLPNYPRTPRTCSEAEIERNNLDKREAFKPVRVRAVNRPQGLVALGGLFLAAAH